MTEHHLLQKLSGKHINLTGAERKLQKYITSNLSSIANLNILSLEANAQVSKSTISRYCRKMGYVNFREFFTALAQEVALNYSNIHVTAQAGDDTFAIARKLYVLESETLKTTFSSLNSAVVDQVVSCILQAPLTHIFSSGGSGAIAYDFYHKLLRLGERAIYQQDIILQKMQAEAIQSGELAVVFSLSGHDRDMVEIAAKLKASGIMVVCLTNGYQSPLAKESNISLYGAYREDFLYTGTIESRLSLMYLVDLLFILLSMKGAPNTTDMIQKTKEVLDRSKIFNNKAAHGKE